MDIVKHRRIFFTISSILILASVAAFILFGLRQGIDLVGGTNWQIQIKNQSTQENEIKAFLTETTKNNNLTIKSLSSGSFLIKSPSVSEEQHSVYLRALQEKFGEIEEQSFESIGPTVGQELKNRFLLAFALGLLGILLYVAWAFRKVSYPIKSWEYGLIGILCLFHDILIPTGIMAFLGWRQGIEIDTGFIVALMFILGYSINDTIVVFDRIRENLLRVSGKHFEMKTIINDSINQIIPRSLNTSLTTILALIAVYFWGPAYLEYFTLTLILGIFFGTYSSIFIASPLLYVFQNRRNK